ncbi:hypothetical protein CLIB1423_04S04104 [[Candida] railenensis]|uniref:Uncharacterized protein n=1 Tax=[Candida] railenensis TaxID=45579 RepID=A0A9P0QN98_9ASCO|nr:hypothetical protein CLIB1423_04S04104 [[Candida] railenensis]
MSRRNSMTSNVSISTNQSSNLIRNTSIEHLMGNEDKFSKKAMKRTPTQITNGKQPRSVSPPNNSPPKPAQAATSSPGGGFHKQQGIYYFPNGEVFRPRNSNANTGPPKKKVVQVNGDIIAPKIPALNSIKSSKVGKLNLSTKSSFSEIQGAINSNSPASKASTPSPSSNVGNNAPDGILTVSNNATNSPSATLPRSSSMTSFTSSPSFLTKSNSVNNMKKINLVQSIRASTIDTPTNISIESPANNNGSNNTSPTRVIYQSTNIVRSSSMISFEDHNNNSASGAGNATTSSSHGSNGHSNSDSNPSSLSNYNLNRSLSNTPTTSINNSIDETNNTTVNTSANITSSKIESIDETVEPAKTIHSIPITVPVSKSGATVDLVDSPVKPLKLEKADKSDTVLDEPIEPLSFERVLEPALEKVVEKPAEQAKQQPELEEAITPKNLATPEVEVPVTSEVTIESEEPLKIMHKELAEVKSTLVNYENAAESEESHQIVGSSSSLPKSDECKENSSKISQFEIPEAIIRSPVEQVKSSDEQTNILEKEGDQNGEKVSVPITVEPVEEATPSVVAQLTLAVEDPIDNVEAPVKSIKTELPASEIPVVDEYSSVSPKPVESNSGAKNEPTLHVDEPLKQSPKFEGNSNEIEETKVAIEEPEAVSPITTTKGPDLLVDSTPALPEEEHPEVIVDPIVSEQEKSDVEPAEEAVTESLPEKREDEAIVPVQKELDVPTVGPSLSAASLEQSQNQASTLQAASTEKSPEKSPQSRQSTYDTSDEDLEYTTPSNSPPRPNRQLGQEHQDHYVDYQKGRAFEKLLNDEQNEVPPRGDLAVLSNTVRKHERNSSSLSSFNDIIEDKGANNSNNSNNNDESSEVETIRHEARDEESTLAVVSNENETLPVAESSPISKIGNAEKGQQKKAPESEENVPEHLIHLRSFASRTDPNHFRLSTVSDRFEGFPVDPMSNHDRPSSIITQSRLSKIETPVPSPNIDAFTIESSPSKRDMKGDRSISPIDEEYMHSDSIKGNEKLKGQSLRYSSSLNKNLVLPSPIAEESASALVSPASSKSSSNKKLRRKAKNNLKKSTAKVEPPSIQVTNPNVNNRNNIYNNKPHPQLPNTESFLAFDRPVIFNSDNTMSGESSPFAPSFATAKTSFASTSALNLNEFHPPNSSNAKATSPISISTPSFTTAQGSVYGVNRFSSSAFTLNSSAASIAPSIGTINLASAAASIRAIPPTSPSDGHQYYDDLETEIIEESDDDDEDGIETVDDIDDSNSVDDGDDGNSIDVHDGQASVVEEEIEERPLTSIEKEQVKQKEEVSTPTSQTVRSMLAPLELGKSFVLAPPSKFKPTPPTPPTPPVKSLLNESVLGSPVAMKSLISDGLPSPTVKSTASDALPTLSVLTQEQKNVQEIKAPKKDVENNSISSVPPTPPQKSPPRPKGPKGRTYSSSRIQRPAQPLKSMLDVEDPAESGESPKKETGADSTQPPSAVNFGSKSDNLKQQAAHKLNKAKSTPNLKKAISSSNIRALANNTSFGSNNNTSLEESGKPGLKRFFKKMFTVKPSESGHPIATEVSINTSCNSSFVSGNSAGGVSMDSLLRHADSNYIAAYKNDNAGFPFEKMNHSTHDFSKQQMSSSQTKQPPSMKVRSRSKSRSDVDLSSRRANHETEVKEEVEEVAKDSGEQEQSGSTVESVAPTPPPKNSYTGNDSLFMEFGLPTLEKDVDMFSDMLTSFDERFKRNSLFSKSDKTPFLQDDELTQEQIEDQQIKDQDGYSKEGSSTEELPTPPPKDHMRTNSDELYVDDNILFLQNEVIWIDDMKSIAGSIVKRRASAKPKRNVNKEVTGSSLGHTVTTAQDEEDSGSGSSSDDILDTILDNGDEYIDVIYNDENGRQYSIRRNRTYHESSFYLFPDDETETIVIDNEQLTNLFNNLSESQRRQLPMHLKYIKQFQDYENLEITIKTGRKRIVKGQQPAKPSLKRFQYPPNVKRKNVAFGNKIYVNETYAPEMYKRYNKSVTQYTISEPNEINKIKTELNQYKCNEMLVHEQSQNNTHFFY